MKPAPRSKLLAVLPQLDRRQMLSVLCLACAAPACGGPMGNDGGAEGGDASPGDASMDAQPDSPAQEAGADGSGGEGGEGGVPCTPPRNSANVGAITDFPVGSLRVVSTAEVDAIVGRDRAGFWALTTACPHFGGVLEVQSTSVIHCTNMPTADHNALFDQDGVPTRDPGGTGWGPAGPRNVNTFKVTLCNGRVYLTADHVPTGSRTALT